MWVSRQPGIAGVAGCVAPSATTGGSGGNTNNGGNPTNGGGTTSQQEEWSHGDSTNVETDYPVGMLTGIVYDSVTDTEQFQQLINQSGFEG